MSAFCVTVAPRTGRLNQSQTVGQYNGKSTPKDCASGFVVFCYRICTQMLQIRIAPTIDLVLLSHGDLKHSGFYPYAYARWGLKAPTYSTLPVQAMARIAVTEDVDGLREEEDIGDEGEIFQVQETSNSDSAMLVDESTADGLQEPKTPSQAVKKTSKYVAMVPEVQEAFDSVHTLRYSQPTHLQGALFLALKNKPHINPALGKCQGMTITPFNAGHTLGGAIWKIRSPSSGTILYAVDMNHMKERHLDGTVLTRQSAGGVFEPLARPDLLITDANRVNVTTSRRKDRDAALLGEPPGIKHDFMSHINRNHTLDTVTTTLSSRLSLLLPCDSSSRVLELLVLLDQHWNYSRLRYPICILSRSAAEMLTFVRSMMEWLGGTISKEDVGEEGGRQDRKRKRDDDDEEALGALALRFK
jgi:cleavage and polyadenylation specificity factor subunit 2